jgi:hypothetical protein
MGMARELFILKQVFFVHTFRILCFETSTDSQKSPAESMNHTKVRKVRFVYGCPMEIQVCDTQNKKGRPFYDSRAQGQSITNIIYLTFQVVKAEDRVEILEEEALEEVVVPMVMEGALEVGVVIPEEHQEIIMLIRVVEEVVHTTVHFKIYIPAKDTTVAMVLLQ